MSWQQFDVDRNTNELVCGQCGERWPNNAQSVMTLATDEHVCRTITEQSAALAGTDEAGQS